MFGKPSLVTRIAIGKGIGFLVGLIGFISLPLFLPEAGWLIRWGILLWYTTLGAIIGVFGVFTYHPVLKLPMPWWFRAPLLGADGILTSPFWFAAEGALVGLVIGYVATRFGGEGKETVGK